MLDKLKKNKQQIEAKEIDESNVEKKHATNYEIESPGKLVLRRLKQNKFAMIGLALLIFMFVFSFIGPLLSPYGYNDRSALVKAAPSLKHWFGTDYLGRDVLTRVMVGGRISIAVGVVSVVISVVVGTLVGSIAGYYGGKIDYFLMAFTDIFLSIPFLPIVILMGSMLSDLKVNPNMRIVALMFMLGLLSWPSIARLVRGEILSIVALMFMLGLLSWPSIARLVRGEILSLREQEFMQATESLGLKDTRKIIKHLIPNVIPTIIVNATLGVASAILTESALSYLGMGVVEPTPSWGNMISASNKAIDLQKRPWLWMPPGACMVITVMAVNLFGDALRDALDPKKRR